MTITEALAEIKTIKKRIEKKRQFVHDHLFLQGHLKDPLEKDGGSAKAIAESRQSILDLEERVVKLRLAIARANSETSATVGNKTMTINAWLIWKRDVAPGLGEFLERMRNEIASVRRQVQKAGGSMVEVQAADANEVSIYISEKDLAEQIETHEQILGELDGKLSLINATVQIEV